MERQTTLLTFSKCTFGYLFGGEINRGSTHRPPADDRIIHLTPPLCMDPVKAEANTMGIAALIRSIISSSLLAQLLFEGFQFPF